MSKTTRRLVAAGFAAVLGATTLAACGEDEAVRDAETNEVTESGNADAFTLAVGDCLMSQDGTEFSEAPVVPCSEPHDEEIFYSFDLEDGDYPGDDAVQAEAIDTCGPEFETFVGLAYEESELDFYPITPTAESWDGIDDREVLCTIYDPSGPVEGTLEGAAY